MDVLTYTEDGTTYRVGQPVLRVDFESDGTPAYPGVITRIVIEYGEATYWILWEGAAASDPHGAYAFAVTEHVHFVHEPGQITVLHIPDPELARNPRAVAEGLASGQRYEGVEVIIEATRYDKSKGEAVSGWVVSNSHFTTDHLLTEQAAMRELRAYVAERFSA